MYNMWFESKSILGVHDVFLQTYLFREELSW